MTDVDIRPATPDDAPRLAALRWEFRSGRMPTVEDRDAFVARCTDWMREELRPEGSWRAWVAVSRGRIVGQVWLDSVQKLPNPGAERERHAYLSNLYVTPSERGGIGTRLVETAVAWARANAVDRIVLWPTAASITLYSRHGFTRDGVVMELTC